MLVDYPTADISTQRKIETGFQSRDKCWDPSGVARLSTAVGQNPTTPLITLPPPDFLLWAEQNGAYQKRGLGVVSHTHMAVPFFEGTPSWLVLKGTIEGNHIFFWGPLKKKIHPSREKLGMGQNKPTRGPQVLVFCSISQGNPF